MGLKLLSPQSKGLTADGLPVTTIAVKWFSLNRSFLALYRQSSVYELIRSHRGMWTYSSVMSGVSVQLSIFTEDGDSVGSCKICRTDKGHVRDRRIQKISL